MNTVARIAKNTLCLAIAHIVTMALGLFFVAVLARLLGDAGFGKYHKTSSNFP
jgi:O-antigen/teichoic acid export membrane protein